MEAHVNGKSLFESFQLASVSDAVKDIYESILMTREFVKIIRVAFSFSLYSASGKIYSHFYQHRWG